VNALHQTLTALVPGGVVLDLQVIRPDPRIEADGRFVCEIDGEPLFVWADAARAAVDAAVASGRLVDEAVDDHDVRSHYDDGAELVADRAESKRKIPPEFVEVVRAIVEPCAIRERCRLRRLRVR
jgi:hypothetical protein